MLRRRKEDVEGELPGRTINTYFVPMHKEQMLRYEEYETKVARLAAMARKRPLKKEEMERLQQYLACMRMLCDTPYILDQDCRISPKLKELGNILQETPGGWRSQDHYLFRVGAHAGTGPGAGRRNGTGLRLAYRQGPAAETPRRDPALQERSRMPAVPLHRLRRRRTQPAGRRRGHQPGPALESGQAGAAHRPRLAQSTRNARCR